MERNLLEFRFLWRWPRAVRTLGIRHDAFADADPTRICFAVVRGAETGRQLVFDLDNREHTVSVAAELPPQALRDAPVAAQARQFTLPGLKHIATGCDHVAFIIGLLLVTRTFPGLVKIVTAFTLAHSLTLAAATLGWVDATAWFVEPAIAVTIAAVGIENLFRLRRASFYSPEEIRLHPSKRWITAFCFGLIHGFGFASVLKELNLSAQGIAISLVCFNLGVEIGQVAIVAALFPMLWGLEHCSQRGQRGLARSGSAIIIALEAFWFAQRVGLI